VLVSPSATAEASAESSDENPSCACTRGLGGAARWTAPVSCAGGTRKNWPGDGEHMRSARAAARKPSVGRRKAWRAYSSVHVVDNVHVVDILIGAF
jgi:hypothetical protein